MLGKQVLTPYGCGFVEKCGSTVSDADLTVRLDWHGTLYAVNCKKNILKESFADIGQCALTRNHGTCLILDYDKESHSHSALIFVQHDDELNASTASEASAVNASDRRGSVTPVCIRVPCEDFVRTLPACVGLIVHTEKGYGAVKAYIDVDDVFEVSFRDHGVERLGSNSVCFDNAKVYPTASFILDKYILQTYIDRHVDESIASFTASVTNSDKKLVSVISDTIQKASSMSVHTVREQIHHFQDLLMQSGERINKLIADANEMEVDVEENSEATERQKDLKKLKKLLMRAYEGVCSISKTPKDELVKKAEETVGVKSSDVSDMMQYYAQFNSLVTEELHVGLDVVKQHVQQDEVLRDLLERVTTTQKLVVSKLQVLCETKSYAALLNAKDKLGGRLNSLLANTALGGKLTAESLSAKLNAFVASDGAQQIVKHGGSLWEQCNNSPVAASLMEKVFDQSVDSVFGAGTSMSTSLIAVKAEDAIRTNVLALNSVLNNVDHTLDAKENSGSISNSTAFFPMMVVSMLNMADAGSAVGLSNDKQYDVATLREMFTTENMTLKHTLCLKLCAMLSVVVCEEEKNGRILSGSEILLTYQRYPMQSMVTMFNMFSTNLSQMGLGVSNTISQSGTANSILNSVLNSSSQFLEQHPDLKESMKKFSTAAMAAAVSVRHTGAVDANASKELLKLTNADAAVEGFKAILNSDYAEGAVNSMAESGDRILSTVENLRDNAFVQQAMNHLSDDLETDDILNYAISKATSTNIDVNSVLTQVEALAIDKEARQRLVDMWKDQILDFLIGLLPTMTVPDIDGIKDDLQYHVSGLDMSGIKLKKENVQITLVDSLFDSNGSDQVEVLDLESDEMKKSSAISTAPTSSDVKQLSSMDLFRIRISGISANFNNVEWKYSQLFFPHMHGDGKATASVDNATLDMGFKLVRVPKGVIQMLASDPEGPFKSSLKIYELFNNGTLKQQVEAVMNARIAVDDANVDAGGVPRSVSNSNILDGVYTENAICDWGEEVEEWEPAFVMSSNGKQKLFSIEKLQLSTEQNSAVLSWLYNMIANLFEKTIKEYVCLTMIDVVETNGAVLLSYINSSMASYFPIISQLTKISVDKVPKATAEDLYMLIGPDPNVDGYHAGPKREIVLKFNELGALGIKLDIVTTPADPANNVIANTKAVVTGAKECSQAERVFNSMEGGMLASQLYMSTIVTVNGKKMALLGEDGIMAALKNPKRPLSIGFRLSEEVYSLLSSSHADAVSRMKATGASELGTIVHTPVAGWNSDAKIAKTSGGKRSRHRRKLKVTKAVFGEGALGLKLKETKSCGGAVIITGFAVDKDGGMLQAEKLGVLETGMIMLAVEGTVVFGKPFEKVMEIIKKCPRPLSMLFVKSPDLQVNFPPHITTVTDRDLILGMIEGYVMVTANHLSQLPGGCVAADGSERGMVEYNVSRLVPGMVILQVNKQPVTTSSSVNHMPQKSGDKLVPQPVQDVFTLMNAANPIKLAIRDMDSFMHLIRIRDGVETIEHDVELA